MNKASIGHKFQSFAKLVLIAGLIQGVVVLAVFLLTISQAIGSGDILGYFGFAMISLTSITSGAIWNILLPFIAFYCIKGFGQLLINSDEMVRIQSEGLELQKMAATPDSGETESA
jgi:hypothetical protein